METTISEYHGSDPAFSTSYDQIPDIFTFTAGCQTREYY